MNCPELVKIHSYYHGIRGVPYMAVVVVLLLSCLAYLSLGSGTAKVVNWILK